MPLDGLFVSSKLYFISGGYLMHMSLRLIVFASACSCALTGCIQTEQLYAVRKIDPDHSPALKPDAPRQKATTIAANAKRDPTYDPDGDYPDDRPGVIMGHQQVKASFRHVAADQCATSKLKSSQPGQTPATWAAANKFAYNCVSRIAAYAIDQCVTLSLAQNSFTGTTKLLVGTALVGAALATDSVALAAPNDPNKTAVSALGVAVAANGGGISGLTPPVVQPPISGMITVAATYAEAVGISDVDFTGSLPPTKSANTSIVNKTENSSKPETTTKKELGTTSTKDHTRTSSTDDTKLTDDITMTDDLTTVTTNYIPSPDGRSMRPDFILNDELVLKLARTHDAVLSQCTADKIGLGRVGHPRGVKVTR